MRRVVALGMAMLCGCSFATMRSPRGSPPECTDSSAAPLVDIAIAVASPLVAYAILKSNEDPRSSPTDPALNKFIRGVAAVVVSFPVWGIAGTSSIYGFIRAGRCTRAKRDYQQLMAAPPGPGPYAPPPIAPTGAPPPMYPAPYPTPYPTPYPPPTAPAPVQ